MQFEVDHRKNERLHKLYVSYALQELRMMQEFCEDMSSLSRWPASNTTQLVWDEARKRILTEAAWFEAAALLYAKADTSAYPSEVGYEEETSCA